ncbi:TPA: cytochrome c [Pseudomonas aeruginosa]|uniref:c-type cytochrome n=1 Tax=Pseudomonas aeruginosa TaxID=287 RepID=UPI000B491745|nr:cytochrome c [Pseudomonas aeruginosa]EKU7417866.1 cytochrome c [Pseudomonas aeruginosa]EKV4051746.1 cytochrome c [Pseudomonas aeruginosa]MBF2891818.1 cytochrome c [Pseudomonas aeruginosa]MBF2923776.1 cytochrome c [Pseudomonas aeruginosa]MBF2938715.1 cytochrome c [Pseudomonas aeruginosa]
MTRPRSPLAALALCTALSAGAAQAAEQPPFSGPDHFDESSGEALFQGICQGCHMPQAQGAAGAGHYPALAHNPRLAAAAYPIYMVSHGNGGMPSFKDYLSDEQIAAVVNYVRTHFDNHYADTVKIDDVKKITQR